jgi:phosphinothricin acetyltransferase
MEKLVIRAAATNDAEAIARIYNHFILNTVVTFEEQAVSVQEITSRINATAAAALPWLVAEKAGLVVGYAYASKWHGRCAYRHSAECTVYLDPAVLGQGFGTKLYDALFGILRSNSMHTVIGVIALPNPASVALHEKFGFSKVGHFKEVGFKFNQWVDVGYWQSLL